MGPGQGAPSCVVTVRKIVKWAKCILGKFRETWSRYLGKSQKVISRRLSHKCSTIHEWSSSDIREWSNLKIFDEYLNSKSLAIRECSNLLSHKSSSIPANGRALEYTNKVNEQINGCHLYLWLCQPLTIYSTIYTIHTFEVRPYYLLTLHTIYFIRDSRDTWHCLGTISILSVPFVPSVYTVTL